MVLNPSFQTLGPQGLEGRGQVLLESLQAAGRQVPQQTGLTNTLLPVERDPKSEPALTQPSRNS